MKTKKIDRRVQRTKKALRNSIITLLSKESINKITVSQLCELSDINRSTFYSYYSDVYDLLNQIKHELFEELQVSVEKYNKDISINSLLIEVLNIISNNKDLYISILKNGDTNFLRNIIIISCESKEKYWNQIHPDIPKYKLEYMHTFTTEGIIAIIKRWIQSDMKETTNEIAELIEEFCLSVSNMCKY